MDGELGRLCRGGGMTDVAIVAGSDSDGELCGLGAMSGQQTLASYDGMGTLHALMSPESATPMDRVEASSRSDCRDYVAMRKAMKDENLCRDLSELRRFVQDRPGGQNVLFPVLQQSGLPYTLCDLRQVIRELSQEEVDYADLQKALTELETDKDLYDVQK